VDGGREGGRVRGEMLIMADQAAFNGNRATRCPSCHVVYRELKATKYAINCCVHACRVPLHAV